MDGVSVRFFPSDGNAKYLGGGYLQVRGLQTRFSVFPNTKKECGFLVALPSHKDHNGEWVNDVEIMSKEISDFVYSEVGTRLGSAPSSPVASGATAVSTGAAKENWSQAAVKPPF